MTKITFFLITIGLSIVGLVSGGCANDDQGADNSEGHAEAFRDGTLTQVLSNLLGQEMRGNPPPVSNVHAAVLSVNQQQQSQQFRQSQEYGGPPPPLPQQQYNNNNNIQQQYGPGPQESPMSSGTSLLGTRTSKGSRTFGFEFSFGDRIKPLQRGPRPPPPSSSKVMQQQQRQQQQYGAPNLPQQHDKLRQGPLPTAYGPPNSNLQQGGGYLGNQNQQQQQQQYGPPASQQQQYGLPQMQMIFIPQVIPQIMQQQQQQYGAPGGIQGFQQIRMNFPAQFQQQQQQGPLRTYQQDGGIESNSIAGAGGPSIDTKFVYLFAPPPDPIDEVPQKPQVISYPGGVGGKRDKNYQIIFVKAPGAPEPRPVEIQMPPLPEQKTMVYVLVKKPLRNGPNIRFSSPPTTTPSPPEVFFVKYKRNENMPSTSDFRSLPESIQDNLMDTLGDDQQQGVTSGGYNSSGQQGIKRGEKLRSTSDMGGFIRSSSNVQQGSYNKSNGQRTTGSATTSHYRAPGSRPWEQDMKQVTRNGDGGGYGKK